MNKWIAAAVRLAVPVVLASAVSAAALAAGSPSPNLIPWPKSVKLENGSMTLSGSSRIVFTDATLEPLAKVLSDEVYLSTAVRLKTGAGPAGAGDIVLQLDPKFKGESYALNVDDRAAVRGGNYRAVAWGTVTLLQGIEPAEGGRLRLAKMAVEDEPVAAYRGLMIDVARQWHPAQTLRPLIEMCRLYKINYLQLHLNDQQSFTFPSKAFPSLASSSKGQRRTYTPEEITGLVRYGNQRGVTLVPEIEGPGHHSGALRSLWGRKGTSCMDMASEKTYEGMDTLIGEVCDVFAFSPYIHIGADEADLHGVGTSDEEKAFMAQHGLQGAGGLYNYYIVRMNEIIKKHGRQTICWEGFHGDGGGGAKIPKDVIVMEFEIRYNVPQNLVKNGYNIINAAWTPLYVVGGTRQTPEHIYDWDVYRFGQYPSGGYDKVHWTTIAPTPQVLGAQMCAWEQSADVELPSTRDRVHAMSERVWNPDARRNYADFAARAAKTNKLLDRVLGMVDVQAKGLMGKQKHDFEYFWDPITVSLWAPPIGTIHYTIDGKDPTAASPAYAAPITLSKNNTHSEKLFYNRRVGRYQDQGDVVRLKARIFDAGSRPIGDVITIAQYWHRSPEEIAQKEPEEKNPPQATTAPAKDKAQTKPAGSKKE